MIKQARSAPGPPGRRGWLLLALVTAAALAATVTVAEQPAPGIAVAGSQPLVQLKSVPALLVEPPTPAPPPTLPPTPSPQLLVAPLGPRVTVPILVYHYIRVNPVASDRVGYNLSVTPQLFAEQMELLHEDGVVPITFDTLMNALSGHGGLPPHPVILTFDDGYADFATAAQPVLTRQGFSAVTYVVGGFINRPGYMSAEQVRAADAAGMVVGAHTMHHVNLARLSLLAASAEITGSKSTLEQLLGHPVLDFAYPYGGFTPAVESLVQQAGFREAVSTLGGTLQTWAGRFALRRTHMGGAQDLAFFARAAGLPVPDAAQMARVRSSSSPTPSPASSPTPSPSASPS